MKPIVVLYTRPCVVQQAGLDELQMLEAMDQHARAVTALLQTLITRLDEKPTTPLFVR